MRHSPSCSGNINALVTTKVGAVITFTVPATVAANATGTITNTATVNVPAGVIDPTPGNNSATDSDTVTAATADLAIAKSNGVNSLTPGGNTTYTIIVPHNGPPEATRATGPHVAPTGPPP